MYSPNPPLNDGEKSLIKWQYHQHGGFWTAQWDAISRADHHHLFQLTAAFPKHVKAYLDFSETGLLTEKVDAILAG